MVVKGKRTLDFSLHSPWPEASVPSLFASHNVLVTEYYKRVRTLKCHVGNQYLKLVHKFILLCTIDLLNGLFHAVIITFDLDRFCTSTPLFKQPTMCNLSHLAAISDHWCERITSMQQLFADLIFVWWQPPRATGQGNIKIFPAHLQVLKVNGAVWVHEYWFTIFVLIFAGIPCSQAAAGTRHALH